MRGIHLKMNSIGPVSLVSHAIYKVLHYLNWFSDDNIKDLNHNSNDIDSDSNAHQFKPSC